jgi:hypothetical protein
MYFQCLFLLMHNTGGRPFTPSFPPSEVAAFAFALFFGFFFFFFFELPLGGGVGRSPAGASVLVSTTSEQVDDTEEDLVRPSLSAEPLASSAELPRVDCALIARGSHQLVWSTLKRSQDKVAVSCVETEFVRVSVPRSTEQTYINTWLRSTYKAHSLMVHRTLACSLSSTIKSFLCKALNFYLPSV